MARSKYIKPLLNSISLNDLGFRTSIGNEYDFLKEDLNADDEAICLKILDWVDSCAADKYNIDCNNNDKVDLLLSVVHGFYEYQKQGGSKKERKESAKKNPEELFNGSGLKVAKDCDCSGCDVAIISSLENDDFMFTAPLTYKAMNWMNTFDFGGQGARWCTGYSKNVRYWNEYIVDKHWLSFVVLRKKELIEQKNNQTLKYLISVADTAENTEIWLQKDLIEDTIPIFEFKSFLGYDVIELIKAFADSVLRYDTVYSASAPLYVDENFNPIIDYSDYRQSGSKLLMSQLPEYPIDMIKKHWSFEVNLDCEGKIFELNDMTDFDLAKISEWLESLGLADKSITIFNAKMDRCYINKKIKNNVYFKNCSIAEMYFTADSANIFFNKEWPTAINTLFADSKLVNAEGFTVRNHKTN